MDTGGITLLCTVIAAACGAAGWLLPSPRERAQEREQHITGRVAALESDHRSLERKYIESTAKLVAKVDNLSAVCADLAAAIRELTKRIYRGDGT